MSSGDDPLAVEDKTVVSRGRDNRADKPPSSGDKSRNQGRSRTPEPSDTTVISMRPVPDDDDRTVVAGSHAPPVQNSDEGSSRTVIAADTGTSPHPAEPYPPDVWQVPVGSIRVAGSGPILAAATPILMMLARFQQETISDERNAPYTALEANMERFRHDLATVGLGRDDIQKAAYVLCAAVDDIVGNIQPGRGSAGDGLLKRNFGRNDGDVRFFEILNGLLAAPAPHHDLLQTMHACLSLGFKGQYRQRDDAALEQVRADIHATLRHLEADRREPGAKVAANRSPADKKVRVFPVWTVAAAIAAVSVVVYLALLLSLTSETNRVAGKLKALVPPGNAVIERGLDGS